MQTVQRQSLTVAHATARQCETEGCTTLVLQWGESRILGAWATVRTEQRGRRVTDTDPVRKAFEEGEGKCDSEFIQALRFGSHALCVPYMSEGDAQNR